MIVSTRENPQVIEAISSDVHLTDLSKFLARSVNEKGQPRVMIGRLKTKYQYLIPKAISQALSWIGLPYNNGFKPDNHLKSFYCSQLIYSDKMNFKQDGKLLPAWKEYFARIHAKVPQSELGTNPGMISRFPKINIIYEYGGVRKCQGSHSITSYNF